ncbi:MAG: UDP-N-acetylglucosamine 1-carboxyvinyltransferase [Clostridia bacterium]|nr:UDP-N-acetylglucosamine 1-carboxyvinyltransferase [Clostridia bacterium]
MPQFEIIGGNTLGGNLKVETSKNAVLPIIAACILTDEEVVLKDVPEISDAFKMFEILRAMGAKVQLEDATASIDCSTITKFEIPSFLAKEIRSSIFMLGPLIAKYKRARVAYPGGCDIGARPIDLHLYGLKELGVIISEAYGFIDCYAEKIIPSVVHLDYPSVGATENIMMASVLSPGKTVIINSAKEPEIVDLASFINSMGGRVSGAGTSTIIIEGVSCLHGTTYTPISDRIIAGTYLIAAAITGSSLTISNAKIEDNNILINKLRNSGCYFRAESDKIHIEANSRLSSIQTINTQPYPGFPTDLQAQIMALETVSDGVSVITENLFETRFKHVPELMKLGANITLKGNMAIVRGVKELYGAEVSATDLRGGASLVLAGLVAKGKTTISNIEFIDRGYPKLEEKLASVGANITRI